MHGLDREKLAEFGLSVLQMLEGNVPPVESEVHRQRLDFIMVTASEMGLATLAKRHNGPHVFTMANHENPPAEWMRAKERQ